MGDHPHQRPHLIPVISGYRDLTLIANGGFSSVYTARQERFDRTVAVKVLHTDVQDAETQRRFADECMLTGRLTGQPHVISVFDAGVTEDGRPFLAMQYLPGGSLADRLASSGPLPVQEVTRIGTAVASALAAAHEANILHRDIKPGNILMSADGQPVLSDFGIASRYHPAVEVTSPDTTVAFTPAYTAPEVQEGRPPSVASDIYSLGATLYTLLAGTPPLRGVTDQAVLHSRIRAGDFPDPDRADLPVGLMALIRRCLAYEPGQRPGSARQFANDLAAPVAQLARQGTPNVPPQDEPTRMRPERLRRNSTVPGPRRERQTAKTAAVTAVALAALAVVGFGVAQVVPKSHPVSAPSLARHSTAPASVTTRPPPKTSSPPSTAPSTPAPTPPPATAGPPPTVFVTPPVAVVPPSAATSPPPAAPAPKIRFVKGSDASLNSASGHGCKVWMNERTPGAYFQGLIWSWGDNCDLTFYQSTNGGRGFSPVSQKNHVASATTSTGFYWNGNGRFAMVCLHDAATGGKPACGQASGG